MASNRDWKEELIEKVAKALQEEVVGHCIDSEGSNQGSEDELVRHDLEEVLRRKLLALLEAGERYISGDANGREWEKAKQAALEG